VRTRLLELSTIDISQIRKPSEEIIELFRRTPTSCFYDATVRPALGVLRGGLCMTEVRAVSYHGQRMVGPAGTLRFGRIRGVPSHPSKHRIRMSSATEQFPAGTVIVIEGVREERSVWGELATKKMVRRNMAGLVTDGFVRDLKEIRETGFTMFARGTTPIGYVPQYEVIEVNGAVNCGGVQVRPGDIIVGDEDGVVAVPSEMVEEYAKHIKEINYYEDKMREAIGEGKPSDQIYKSFHVAKYGLQ